MRCHTLAALRVTPWRMLLIEGIDAMPDLPGLITQPDDPLLRVIACTGAPGLPARPRSRRARWRDRWRRSLPTEVVLHVSGCAKGCAHPGAAAFTLTAQDGGFDLIRDGHARDAAVRARPDGRLPRRSTLPSWRVCLMPHTYETDGAAIYQQSFATIRAEADLAPLHGGRRSRRGSHDPCRGHGRAGAARSLSARHGDGGARGAGSRRADLLRRADGGEGITRARLPAANDVICTLHDPAVPELARKLGNTRSAAAVELWRPHLAGAVVAIGNAPTALFHLLEHAGRPGAARALLRSIGCPVGFVGAAESRRR